LKPEIVGKSELVKMEGELVGESLHHHHHLPHHHHHHHHHHHLLHHLPQRENEYLDVEFLITIEWMPPQRQREIWIWNFSSHRHRIWRHFFIIGIELLGLMVLMKV
jgi:hypothetical protein